MINAMGRLLTPTALPMPILQPPPDTKLEEELSKHLNLELKKEPEQQSFFNWPPVF